MSGVASVDRDKHTRQAHESKDGWTLLEGEQAGEVESYLQSSGLLLTPTDDLVLLVIESFVSIVTGAFCWRFRDDDVAALSDNSFCILGRQVGSCPGVNDAVVPEDGVCLDFWVIDRVLLVQLEGGRKDGLEKDRLRPVSRPRVGSTCTLMVETSGLLHVHRRDVRIRIAKETEGTEGSTTGHARRS